LGEQSLLILESQLLENVCPVGGQKRLDEADGVGYLVVFQEFSHLEESSVNDLGLHWYYLLLAWLAGASASSAEEPLATRSRRRSVPSALPVGGNETGG